MIKFITHPLVAFTIGYTIGVFYGYSMGIDLL